MSTREEQFIVVNPDLTVSVEKVRPVDGFSVPAKLSPFRFPLSPIEEIVLYKVLYPAADAEAPPGVRHRLMPPDPWLVVIGHLFWQAIAQGMTWDLVKLAAKRALRKLSSLGLSPSPDHKAVCTRTKTELGFSHTSYASDGKKRSDLFLGIRRVYQEKSEEDRAAVTASSIEVSHEE